MGMGHEPTRGPILVLKGQCLTLSCRRYESLSAADTCEVTLIAALGHRRLSLIGLILPLPLDFRMSDWEISTCRTVHLSMVHAPGSCVLMLDINDPF